MFRTAIVSFLSFSNLQIRNLNAQGRSISVGVGRILRKSVHDVLVPLVPPFLLETVPEVPTPTCKIVYSCCAVQWDALIAMETLENTFFLLQLYRVHSTNCRNRVISRSSASREKSRFESNAADLLIFIPTTGITKETVKRQMEGHLNDKSQLSGVQTFMNGKNLELFYW